LPEKFHEIFGAGWRMVPMTEDHIEAVVSIENASFACPWRQALFVEELRCQQALSYVVTPLHGSQVVAFICLRQIRNDLHMLKIAVSPAYRKRGIAVWLLTECCELARVKGMEQIKLEVRPSNLAAKELYLKLGFRQIGIKPKYYVETGEEALVFVKELKEAL
jgi:ribosomal-protein-alanine N-acetyltransferase